MIVVSDTGPLMALAKIGAVDLLHHLYGQVITGPTVYVEAVTAGLAMNADDAHLLHEAYGEGKLTARSPSLDSLPRPGLLHAGEEESIRLAIELQAAWLLIDDFDARQIARENFEAAGVSTGIKGTLGVIVSAVNERAVSAEQAADMVKALKHRLDVWIAPSLCDAVIKTLRHHSSSPDD